MDKDEFDREDFMRAARAGGDTLAAAMDALYRKSYKPLYGECMRAVRDPATADDILQDTFIKAWRGAAGFRGESSVLTWIRNILRNAIIDHARRSPHTIGAEGEAEKVSTEVLTELQQLWLEQVARPEARVQRMQLDESFERCMRRFAAAAPLHATVLRWLIQDGLSNKEIEQLLHRSPGATREFISQSRKKASAYLAEWWELARSTEPCIDGGPCGDDRLNRDNA